MNITKIIRLDCEDLRKMTSLHWVENDLGNEEASLEDLRVCIVWKTDLNQKVLTVFNDSYAEVVWKFGIPYFIGAWIESHGFIHAWETMMWALTGVES